MENAAEEWRDIRDWEGLYQVSNFGRVRSVPRTQVRLSKNGKPTTFRYGYKLLKPGKKDTGYLLVVLSDMTNGRQSIARVHRLVCEAFHGPQPGWDYEVAHSDHDKTNNASTNLRWATHYDNIQDSVRDRTEVADNHSGVIGVSWDKRKRKWLAHLGSKPLGTFRDFEDAVAARRRAERQNCRQSGDVEELSSVA
jgi:hypothetical protein